MEYPDIPLNLNTSDNDLTQDFYEPCLNWADHYDRGVGFFSSGWLSVNSAGLANFASRGGLIRWITSPIVSSQDYETFRRCISYDAQYEIFQKLLSDNLDKLTKEIEENTLNALAWMIYDEIIQFKFVLPKENLDGDFHDKFGIFRKGEEFISFSGSINDSIKGFNNYESIKVFKSWKGHSDYIKHDQARFDKIWNGNDGNLKTFDLPSAIAEKIFKSRTLDRPYPQKKILNSDKWIHQDKAVKIFIEKKAGILAMATGTGKTVTAIKILAKLFEQKKIKRAIITMDGVDLLDQWAPQLRKLQSIKLYKHYRDHKEVNLFLRKPDNAILLILREANYLYNVITQLNKSPGDYTQDTIWIFDEVHGLGALAFTQNLAGLISPFKYRLGLSATPLREYDDEGNAFIKNEVGEQIFEFSLEDAIKKGILCEMNYVPFLFHLSDEEKERKHKMIAAFEAAKKRKEPVDEKQLFIRLAAVNKTSEEKLPIFKKLINENKDILNNCIIFVYSKEYGQKVQDIVIKVNPNYHTYYAGDPKEKLQEFSKGELNYLITCEKISEGIDIKSVKNIILFSSDKSRLVTTQRIGRALRINSDEPEKKATVIDFVCKDATINNKEETIDEVRMKWLTSISQVRREENE